MKITRTRLGKLIPLLVIVGCALIASALYWSALLADQAAQVQAAQQRNELRARQLNEALTQQLDATLRGVDVALKHLRAVHSHDRSGFETAVRDALAAFPTGMMPFVSVFAPNGRTLYTSDRPDAPRPVGGALPDYISTHTQAAGATADADKLFISAPVFERVAGAAVVLVTRGIWDDKDHLTGIIGIALRPDYLSNNLLSLRIDPADLLGLVRPDGQMIARSHKLREALATRLPPDRPLLQGLPGDSGMFRSPSTYDKVPLLFAWHRLSQWPLITVAGINENAEMAALSRSLEQARLQTLVTIAVILAFSLGVSLLMVRIQRKNGELAQSEARHRALFEHSKLPMLLIQPEGGRIVDGNDAACSFYGYSRAELQHLTIGDINQMAPEAIRTEMELARTEQRGCFYFPHRLASGEIRQVEVHSGPMEINGRVLLYSFVHDVTEPKREQEQRAQLLAEQRAILNSEIAGIAKIADRRFIWMNDAYAAMLGYRTDELTGQSSRMLYADDASFTAFAQRAYPVLRRGEVYRTEIQYLRKNGSRGWFDICGELLPGGTESIWSFVDITQRKQMEDQVRQLAFHDALTGLPNRRLLLDRLGQAMSASKRNGRHAAILFLDLDNFKPLNDAYGHEAGDLLLIEAARRLTACVREIDTIARFGGDEFVVMLSDLHADREISLLQAHAVAEKIRATLSQTYHLTVHAHGTLDVRIEHRCTASVGATVFYDHQGHPDSVLSEADAAMYEAKQAGRNAVRFHHGESTAIAL